MTTSIMTHKTRGIILRTVKYGETSLVVTIFTSRFGVQAYMVNGVRTEKKSGSKAAMFQPGAILDLEVYHHPQKSMQRIRESSWAYLYGSVFHHVIKNSIAVYMLELLQKTLRQPEENLDLFEFCEESLIQLDKSGPEVTANMALFFSIHLAQFFGLRIQDDATVTSNAGHFYLDLAAGGFCAENPGHPHVIEGEMAVVASELLRTMQPAELTEFRLNRQTRRFLLQKLQDFYALHIPEFGQMRTWRILQEVLED